MDGAATCKKVWAKSQSLLIGTELDGDFYKNQVVVSSPRVVTREKNSPTVAHACRKRRLKWVLPRLGVGAHG
jgi:hypothetical protein